jgi:hypothetical protein
MSGTIAANGGREVLHVDETVVTESSEASFAGAVTRYLDWRHEPFFGRDAAHRIEMLHGDGSLYFSVDLLEVRGLEPGELDPLLETPQADGSDPIRGPLTVRSIINSKSGHSVVQSGIVGPNPDAPPGAGLQRIAWKSAAVASAVLAFVLIAVRIRFSAKMKG